jgi:hypothetical protein
VFSALSGDQCVLSAAGASFGGQDEDVGGRQGRADEGQVLGSGMTVILILMLWSVVAGLHEAQSLVDTRARLLTWSTSSTTG